MKEIYLSSYLSFIFYFFIFIYLSERLIILFKFGLFPNLGVLNPVILKYLSKLKGFSIYVSIIINLVTLAFGNLYSNGKLVLS